MPCRFVQHGVPVDGVRRYDLEHNFIELGLDRNKELGELYAKYGGREPLLIGWHEIRALLFEYLPAAVVEFDKQVRLTGHLHSVSNVV